MSARPFLIRCLIGADEVELVDLPPDELLQRLAEGKVYIPERAARGRAEFLPEGQPLSPFANWLFVARLSALTFRLRRIATRVRPPSTAERILVCVGPSPVLRPPDSIRCADGSGPAMPLDGGVCRAAWVTRVRGSQGSCVANLRLAHLLGAETATLSGENVAQKSSSMLRLGT